MKCPKCNKEINDNAQFCKYCGQKVKDDKLASENVEEIVNEKSLEVTCPNCGKQMQANKAFCTNCGNPLNGTFKNENDPNEEEATKPKRKRLKVIICLIVLLLIGGALLVAPHFLKTNNNSDKVVEQDDEDESDFSEKEENDKNPDEETEVDFESDTESEENKEIEQLNTEGTTEQIDLEETEQMVIEEITMEKIQTISSSSALTEYNMTHSADRIVDKDIATAWVEGASGQGIGEYIMFELDDEYSVTGFDIYAGYQKNDSLYQKNSRPKEIILEFSDGTQETYVLGDSIRKQTIVFENKKTTDYIKVIIKEIYAGNEYEDTVISEICFY